MIELRITVDSPETLRSELASLLYTQDVRGPTAAEAAGLNATAGSGKRGGKKKTVDTTETQTGAGGSAADPLAGLLAPQSPMAAPTLLGAAAPTLAHTPIVDAAIAKAAKSGVETIVEQKDLIHWFTELGKKKGRDAFAPVLTQFGATAVVGPEGVGIPEKRWAEAIALCQKALAA